MEATPFTAGTKRIPWPGPRPYAEEDWANFFGRDGLVEELRTRIQEEKLTILLGPSGSGKTSLIRAGVVPLLRNERYDPRGNHAVWPVLLLRRWGAMSTTSLEGNLRQQLKDSAKAIRRWGKTFKHQRATEEAGYLLERLAFYGKEGGKAANFSSVIESLALDQASRGGVIGEESRPSQNSRGGGVVLVFDQFEEQLRAGGQAVADALNLIGDLYESAAPTRVLISMRQEYRHALRKLELRIRGLAGRTVYLKPLKESTVIEVIDSASRRSDISIRTDVARRIVGWLGSGHRGHQERATREVPDLEERLEINEQDASGRPDLLRLQAVLLELCRFAVAQKKSQVTSELLDDFANEFGSDEPGVDERARELARAQRVFGGALERWIEAAISNEPREAEAENQESAGRVSRKDRPKWARERPEELGLQIRRIAVRIAPRLSSADYKVSQEENTLFRQALGEDIGRLGIKDPQIKAKIRIIEPEGDSPQLNWEELELSDELTETALQTLSGIARVEEWTPVETGNQMVFCFKESLSRLASANILQATRLGEQERLTYWELVHDQFGPCFTEWAEKQRGTWDDCKCSMVVCSGIQPIAVPVSEIGPPVGEEPYHLIKIAWQGCGVQGSRSERLTLRNVRFVDCFLVGTIFDSIDFVGCTFERCNLNGGLFRKCGFSGEGVSSTMFIRCDSNIAILGGTIDALEFRDCQLRQPAIEATLRGEVKYTNGTRVIQGYYDVKKDGNNNVQIHFDHESRAVHCLFGGDSSKILKIDNVQLYRFNDDLTEEFKVRSDVK